MAFLVRFSTLPPDDNSLTRAIYLDQQFYESIFAHCRNEAGPYQILRRIALLRYKSPSLFVVGDDLQLLDQELVHFAESSRGHPQIAPFRQVCVEAGASGRALIVSGDMYPEL